MGGEEDGSPTGGEVAHGDPEGAPQLHVSAYDLDKRDVIAQ